MTTAVITGATHGLGRLVALDLARRGLDLGIVARSAAKVDDLRLSVEQVAPGTTVDAFVADLSSLDDVRRAAKEIEARYDQVDVLINNAGIHAFSQRVTQDGFAEMVAVNYLAPWVLTNTLRDKLTGRVVTVASEASRHSGGIDPARDLTFTGDYTRRESAAHYGRTKLMDIMFSQELARRLDGTGVTSNCCDPGFNTTGLGRELPLAGLLEKALRGLRIGDPARGASIITRLATDPAFATTTGGYFSVKDAAPLPCPEPGRSADVQRELWEATEKLLQVR
ncbi:SDR family NAD(P)-dependent oxidoreductase [Lentzea sp. BCCO 10_0856]|uniref:SDR family NAD(P)-dependent oxidoreductase n=1 Tax=Lentzea miocenica TaxID=3095431 RepID=A0ABU4T5Y3_9PSEU|nr:SDR family NAD(P)-dependent oxidoreductase [Lentzea sp. BCCO 10_0856]MDX8033353.1 SDR family NAD(P)-dependent oxidoreductase [Lentzea sp. BCCO 10_0856]